MKRYSIIIFILFTFNLLSASDVSLEIQEVDMNNGILQIYMENTVPVAGFQFELHGITIDFVYGGSAEANNFEVAFNSSTSSIIGFSFSGATIDPGAGVLRFHPGGDLHRSDQYRLA